MLRRKFSLIAAFGIALGIHFIVVNTFVYTFPHPESPPKPMFVFLGSFLRADDFMISVRDNPNQEKVHYGQRFNLDIRSTDQPGEVVKPDLTSRINPVTKYQFRPEMNKDQDNLRLEKTDDLGVDLTPFPVIRMRMDRRDQD